MSFECLSTKKDHLIHRATRQGRVIALETYLVQYPIDDINKLYEFGRSKWTLLIAACSYKHENVVRMLLRRFKPDIDAVGDVKLDFVNETICGVSPLWVAVAVGHCGIVKLLVEVGGANVNHLSVTRSSPLRAASYIGDLELARYLIEHGADMRLVRDGNYTNLMLSAYRQHAHLVKYFLDELECDPNEEDRDGRRPLHYAVDSGSLEITQILLMHGAKNSCENVLSPMMWAAMETNVDLVDAFEKHCSTDLEWIEAKELLGASFASVDSKNYNLDKAFEHLTLAFEWRAAKNLLKILPCLPLVEAFDYRQECQTLEQFNQLLSQNHSHDQLHIESFLIRERILGSKNKQYRYSLRHFGAVLADTQQYDATFRFWLYELDLRRQHDIEFDKRQVRDFVRTFAEIAENQVITIPIKAILEIVKVIRDELFHGRDNDYNLLTLLYLITIIAQIPEQQKSSVVMKDIYRVLCKIVQSGYTTKDDLQCSSLLHLSVQMGHLEIKDNLNADLYEQPCQKAIRLLLQCSANIDAIDADRNTPLHLIIQRSYDIEHVLIIIDYLCDDGGAHLDCVNTQGLTPLELVYNTRVKKHLRDKMGVDQLKCLCARLIRERKISIRDYHLSLSLVNFVDKH